MSKQDDPIVGIDLGTTNSAVAIYEGGEPAIIENAEGETTTPSVVAFNDDGEKLVGAPAKRQAVTNNENTVQSIKRHIGEDYSVELQGEDYTPEQISAFILQKLKKDAEDHLGTDVGRAVITVPAYFDDEQRQATKDAGKIAGLEVERIVNEPTAAAMAYGLNEKKDRTIAVYDLGGGTFDISILDIGDDVVEVVATHGDTELGGDDFDQEIINWMAEKFENKNGIDLRDDPMALQRLKDAAEEAKIELSATQQTNINLPFITADDDGAKHLDLTLNRSEFEQRIEEYIDKTISISKEVVGETDYNVGDIDEVVLVGGSTRVPSVQDAVNGYFDKQPQKDVNPDEVVALGAAVQAGVLGGDVDDVLLLDVTPLSLGVETQGGVFTKLIEKNTTIPTQETEIFTTAEDNQQEVEVHVLQGERELAKHNKSLGRFHLTDIPPAPRGKPQIEVTFDIDSNGILNVSAEDKATGEKQEIEITGSANLSEDEIEDMEDEAQKHAEEDKKKRERIEAQNEADHLIHRTRELLEEKDEIISSNQKEKIENELDNLDEIAQNADSASEIREQMQTVQEETQSIGEAVYADQENSSSSTTSASNNAADVSEDDYEVDE